MLFEVKKMSCPQGYTVCDETHDPPHCVKNVSDCVEKRGVVGFSCDPRPVNYGVNPPTTVSELMTDFYLTGMKPIDKSHSSESVFAYATHIPTGLKTIIKGFVGSDENSGLPYEATVYKKLAAMARGVPNLVPCIGTLSISVMDIQKMPKSSWRKYFLYINHHTTYEVTETSYFSLIITVYRPKTTSLFAYLNYLQDYAEDELAKFLPSITFQIVFTLFALNQMGVQHNDLHLRNVLIDLEPPPQEAHITYYWSDQKYVVSLLGGKVLFFDWDRGYLNGNENPSLLNYCYSEGMCNGLNSRLDLFKIMNSMMSVLSSLKDNPVYKDWFDFYSETIGGATSKYALKNNFRSAEIEHMYPKVLFNKHYPCLNIKTYKDDCSVWKEGAYPVYDSMLFTPLQALSSTYFHPFKGERVMMDSVARLSPETIASLGVAQTVQSLTPKPAPAPVINPTDAKSTTYEAEMVCRCPSKPNQKSGKRKARRRQTARKC